MNVVLYIQTFGMEFFDSEGYIPRDMICHVQESTVYKWIFDQGQVRNMILILSHLQLLLHF
jgi:hypothetical protein